MANKIKVHSVFLLILLMIISSICSYYYSDFKRRQDYKNYVVFLKQPFNGKLKIIDKETVPLKFEPYSIFSFNLTALRDEEGKRLLELYNCSNSGWFIHELMTKSNNQFIYNKYDSQDFGFKVLKEKLEKYERYDAYFNEYYADHKLVSTNRGTPQEAFDNALNFKLSELGLENYEYKSYEKINKFFRKISQFYFLELFTKGDYLGNQMIYNDKSIVWYKQSFEDWRIKLNKNEYQSFLYKNLIICNILVLLFFLLWKYGGRIEFNR